MDQHEFEQKLRQKAAKKQYFDQKFQKINDDLLAIYSKQIILYQQIQILDKKITQIRDLLDNQK